MQITGLSSSRHKEYDFCQQKFFIHYVLGYPSKANKKAELGNVVHTVLEGLGLVKLARQNQKTVIENEIFGAQPITSCTPRYLLDIAYKYYKNKSELDYDNSDYEFCATSVENALEYNNGVFDPRRKNIIDVEKYFEIVMPDEWASHKEGNLILRGYIDLVYELDKNTIEIVDWKTGKKMDWNNMKEHDFHSLKREFQLRLYHYAVDQLYPKYDNVICTIFYLNHGGAFSFPFDKRHLKQTQDSIKETFLEIKNNQKPRLLSNTQSHFKCRWCEYQKDICPKIQKSVNEFGLDITTANFKV